MLERFLERTRTVERHSGHQDMEWLAQNRERLLEGELTPLVLAGKLIAINTTTPDSFDYPDLLQQVQTFF